MRLAVWGSTMAVALARRRLFLWNVLVPVLLLIPVVTSAAAAEHRAIVVAVFAAFFGAYGTAVPLLRDGMTGWAEKVWLTGYGGRRWLLEWLAANVAVDFVQLVPVTLFALLLIGAPIAAVPVVLCATAVALLFANALGVLVAAVVRALGEAALACAVASLLALHAAGVFRSPAPGTAWAAAEAWSPLRWIHEVWLAVLRGGDAAWPDAAYVWPQLITLGVVVALLGASGPVLARRVAG